MEGIKNHITKKAKKLVVKIAAIFGILILLVTAIDSADILDLFGDNSSGSSDYNSMYDADTVCIDGMVYDNADAPLYKLETYGGNKEKLKRAKQVRDYMRPILKEMGKEQYIDIMVSMCFNESNYGLLNPNNWMGYTYKKGVPHPTGIDTIEDGIRSFFKVCMPPVEAVNATQIEVLLNAYNMGTLYPGFVSSRGGDSIANRRAFYSKYGSGVLDYPERILSFVKGQKPEEAGYYSSNTANTSVQASQEREKLVAYAEKQIGKDYVYGDAGPDTFDCSGLVMYCYKKALKIDLPRTSQLQYNKCKKIKASEAQKGDLVFFSKTHSTKAITHVGLYIGKDKMIESPRTGLQVRKASISGHGNCVGYGRILAASTTSSTSSKVPLYSMGDSKWKSIQWGGPHVNTIGASGCGPTSIAMVLTYWTGKSITPDVVAKWCNQKNHYIYHGINGMEHNLPQAICKSYNVKCKEISWNNVVSELKKGHVVLTSAKPGLFTNNGHIMVLTGITSNGKITVNDPNGSNYRKANLKDGFKNGFSQKTIQEQTKSWWTTYK